MIYAFENLCFCQLLKKKSEIRRYKFENLLIAILISKHQNCSSIAAEKSEMWRYKFENLLIAFSINRHRHLFSIVDGKSKMGRYKFENLLIAFLISRQRKKMSSKNQPECAFYKKNRPECAFSLFLTLSFLAKSFVFSRFHTKHNTTNLTANHLTQQLITLQK